ncbi:hypothetical protein TSOC_004234 [Tetrabaena socialis]|uniref:TPM domain-containing protein n=1 Tax=Tetrabaena socialis TaxID=47790 RepID=A0A2J8A9N5_9CHLO|nr:hypothetical protein TSOC_004234 [Tetrabaena socialis]|eukprot:PNH09193.1 hypothetical protein TSOC_004234 [Tetrabaena socialis]
MGRLLLALSLVSAAVASAAVSETAWTPETYPNPMVDVTKCGRGVASWICDPDKILSSEAANVVEGLIKKIQAGSPPYVLAPCGNIGMRGFQVAVALARRMQESSDPAGYAERFARALHDSWGVGDAACDNGVVFFLSILDRQLFISSGAGTGKLLSFDVLGDIIADVRPALKDQRYDDAVERAVVDIGLALAGRPVEPEAGGSGSGWDDWVAFGLFASTAGGLAWWAARTDSRKRRRYQDRHATWESRHATRMGPYAADQPRSGPCQAHRAICQPRCTAALLEVSWNFQ